MVDLSNITMHCPKCKSDQSKKNGFRRGKQSYRCKNCGCQYVENPKPKGYSSEVKQLCLKMYLNGMGFRAIARVIEIDHTTIINWVEEAGESLSDEPQDEEIPEITEIDELQTFVGNKNNKFWIWTVVNHQKKGIILWNIGDRSHESFHPIWQIIKCWHSFFYVTDGWKVYPMYIEPEDHLVSKTYMTRVQRRIVRRMWEKTQGSDIVRWSAPPLRSNVESTFVDWLDYIERLFAILNRFCY